MGRGNKIVDDRPTASPPRESEEDEEANNSYE